VSRVSRVSRVIRMNFSVRSSAKMMSNDVKRRQM
jgi:hypothetical protein